ncbi:MAG TPA: hypothetical protein PLP51_03140 [Acholeplasmataceae bacterium]|nr:hypothetical protein [Acholeplasmataceae bacterium]HQC30712.1 hypothetical protein [Acholeplasmataceae bacterium]
MGKNLKNKNLSFYGKKRNLILFFLLGMLVVIIAVFLILFFNKIDNNLLITLSLIAITAYLILFVFLRNKFLVYDTYYQYLLMIENKKDPYKLTMKLFTARWIKKIEETYELKVDEKEFQLYANYIKKESKPLRMKDTLVLVVVAKTQDFNFYSTEVEKEIEMLHRAKNKIRRQIVLQFKRYDELNDEATNEIEQIINFKNGQNQMIHITAGYSDKSNELYFLEPKKRYPSKYYYYACALIKDLTNIRE